MKREPHQSAEVLHVPLWLHATRIFGLCTKCHAQTAFLQRTEGADVCLHWSLRPCGLPHVHFLLLTMRCCPTIELPGITYKSDSHCRSTEAAKVLHLECLCNLLCFIMAHLQPPPSCVKTPEPRSFLSP